MSLQNRIAKLEQEIEPEPEGKTDPERERYWQFLYSDAFFDEMVEKFNALVSSLDIEREKQVMKDCIELYRIDQQPRFDYSDYFKPRAITQYLFLLLKESLEGNYYGPLVIPAQVADYWCSNISETNRPPQAELSMSDCRECGCLVPDLERFGYQPGSGPPRWTVESRANMRCPLCNGAVDIYAFSAAHKDDRDEKYSRTWTASRKHRAERLPFTYNDGELHYWDLMFVIGGMIEQAEAVN
jgi:hypothetical protein